MLIGAESCVFLLFLKYFLCAPKAYKKCDVLFMSQQDSLFLDCHLENA